MGINRRTHARQPIRQGNRPNYNYYPRVTVTVDGAVFFRVPQRRTNRQETRTVTFAADMLGPMNTNGSRVMIIPFDLDHDSPPEFMPSAQYWTVPMNNCKW